MQLDFSILIRYLPDFGAALMVTLKVTVCSLLLGLLFFLFREDADEELLVALGLLLIL